MRLAPVAVILLILAACKVESTSQPAPEAAFPQGDIQAGKAAFQNLKCYTCHEIYGGDMPAPTATPKVPVYLGGNAIQAPDDVYLLRSITDPSHQMAAGWGVENVQSGQGSRMGNYADVMTVRQLIDLVAFLKSRYGPSAASRS